jgi:uncharacterized protein with NAD-binding domain and iron-sulfur cluster
MAEETASESPIKVAVLGGGVAGLTAAFELTRPEHRGRYAVTVYQLGWRLGGKGASGRNLTEGDRIEEHGLHVWFGFYAEAFRLMREVYEALDRPKDVPITTVDEAFMARDQVVLWDGFPNKWRAYPARFPRFGPDPWDEGIEELPTFWKLARRAVQRVRMLLHSPGEEGAATDQRLAEAEALAAEGESREDLGAPDAFVQKLEEARQAFLGLREAEFEALPQLRIIYTTLDAFAAMMRGIVEDVLSAPDGFDAIDHLEWSAWLESHGASSETIGACFEERAPALRGVYDVAFGFREGLTENADVAAGTATNDLLRLVFDYRGSIYYKMRAGMGDVIFAPLYEVLRSRRVSFRFFSAVTELGVTGRSVDTIKILPQIRIPAGEYHPLVPVKKLPCWPSEPLWEQLEQGASRWGSRFETETNPAGKKEYEVLCRGRHFDEVVLAIPVGALEPICGALIKENPRFGEMVTGSATVATQAFQLWTRERGEDLGYPHGPDVVASGYVEPLDTYCDMGHLLKAECWGKGDDVRGIAYVCGVLSDAESLRPEADDVAKANALEYLTAAVGRVWPRALEQGPGSPLMWSVLFDRWDRAPLERRLESQYWRANTAPWERYVITPAESVCKRLASGESGFNNLWLAGDWTKNGINGGCVEAAVVSGLQAARCLTRSPRTIVGEDPTWLKPG